MTCSFLLNQLTHVYIATPLMPKLYFVYYYHNFILFIYLFLFIYFFAVNQLA